jgi:hypothetical protein
MLDGINAYYQQTPPELFPIASMGVDGVHFGYVIHAPEIAADDHPIGEICPMDSDGVILLGNTTQEALENLAGDVVEGENDEQQLQEILHLYELFALRPTQEPNKIRYTQYGNGLPVIPKIPANWLYVPTSDGIGVLAPLEKFRSESFPSIENQFEPDEYLEYSDRALFEDFPATALYYLREGFWNNWANNVDARSFSSRMIETYMKLNRSVLAEVVEWKANKFFSGKNP